jgi:hypothetical protein
MGFKFEQNFFSDLDIVGEERPWPLECFVASRDLQFHELRTDRVDHGFDGGDGMVGTVFHGMA